MLLMLLGVKCTQDKRENTRNNGRRLSAAREGEHAEVRNIYNIEGGNIAELVIWEYR